MTSGRKLTGVVFSDLGQAASFMSLDWVQEALRERLGFAPYPATLNLRLQSPEELRAWREMRKEETGIDVPPSGAAFCRASLYPVSVESPPLRDKVDGAILLPHVDGYPPDKVEVVAAMRIKDRLNVQDGDLLTLETREP
jgi:CTP-dependent riboflavin kinase